MDDRTTIQVKTETWRRLILRKDPGQSFDDVITELLDHDNGLISEPQETVAPTHVEEESEETNLDEVLPGSGSKLQDRRRALEACVEYLRERGEVKASNFQDSVYQDYPGGYETARSWWKNAMYPGLRELAKSDERIQPADSSGVWSWKE